MRAPQNRVGTIKRGERGREGRETTHAAVLFSLVPVQPKVQHGRRYQQIQPVQSFVVLRGARHTIHGGTGEKGLGVPPRSRRWFTRQNDCGVCLRPWNTHPLSLPPSQNHLSEQRKIYESLAYFSSQQKLSSASHLRPILSARGASCPAGAKRLSPTQDVLGSVYALMGEASCVHAVRGD